MDRDHYIMRNKPEKEPHDLTHIWNIEKLITYKLRGQWWLAEAREGTGEG
jgi:hypothetical protein